MKLAVFIERDGILNEVRVEKRQQIVPVSPAEFCIKTNAIEPIQLLKKAGFKLIVITNQPGISRGYLFRRDLIMMHNKLMESFPLDDILVCPHDETDDCNCRKPKTGLFIEAVIKWNIDISRSFVLSNKWQDAEVARRIGCTSILIDSPFIGNSHHDFIVPDIKAAVEKILKLSSPNGRHNRSVTQLNEPIRFVIGDV